MKTVDDALKQILECTQPLPAKSVGLDALHGRILADDFLATTELPPWSNSAMDGYAVRCEDITSLPMILPVVDHIAAGDGQAHHLKSGTAHRIFTGAPVPLGADAIVLQEDVRVVEAGVQISERPSLGQHIRFRGSDVQVGQCMLPAGRVLSAGDISFLASQQTMCVDVIPSVRACVLPSGNELVAPGDRPLGPGQIIDGNSYALSAALRSLGATVSREPAMPDDFASTVTALSKAADTYDVVVTTGGVSVGDHDCVRRAIESLSGDGFGFWKVAIKPGKPIVFAQVGSALVFGLPGNPVSALVTFEIFVRPAILRLMGHKNVMKPVQWATLTAPLKKGGRRREYLRAKLRFSHDELWVTPAVNQSSGSLSSIAGQDALILVEINDPERSKGDRVSVIPLDGTAF